MRCTMYFREWQMASLKASLILPLHLKIWSGSNYSSSGFKLVRISFILDSVVDKMRNSSLNTPQSMRQAKDMPFFNPAQASSQLEADTCTSVWFCFLHVSAGIAIGGDSYPGSTLSDHCLRYENIPQIKIIVVLGELGGTDEYSLVDALKAGKIKKPVVAWVSGTCAKLFKSEVQFGHAGAKSGGQAESAQVSNWHPIIPCSKSLCMLMCHNARNSGDHSLFCLRPFHMLVLSSGQKARL